MICNDVVTTGIHFEHNFGRYFQDHINVHVVAGSELGLPVDISLSLSEKWSQKAHHRTRSGGHYVIVLITSYLNEYMYGIIEELSLYV